MADDLTTLPDLIQGYLDRASETANLPSDLGPPHVGESLTDLHQRLLLTRSAMTSLADLIGELTLFQGRVEATLIERRGVLEEAEATALAGRKRLVEDFSSAKEKNARLGAETLSEARGVRQVEKLLAQVKAASIYCRDRHRELDRAVRDVETRVRILSLESVHI